MIHDTSIILISHDPLILVMIHDTVSYPRVPYHTGDGTSRGFYCIYYIPLYLVRGFKELQYPRCTSTYIPLLQYYYYVYIF